MENKVREKGQKKEHKTDEIEKKKKKKLDLKSNHR